MGRPASGQASMEHMAPENRTMDLRANLTAQRNAAMLFTDLDDTIVMMDPDKGMYYELGSVGSRIWTLLETPGPCRTSATRSSRSTT